MSICGVCGGKIDSPLNAVTFREVTHPGYDHAGKRENESRQFTTCWPCALKVERAVQEVIRKAARAE